MLQLIRKIVEKLKSVLTPRGLLTLIAGTVSHAVRIAWITVYHAVRGGYLVTRATIIGAYFVVRSTVIGTYKLVRAWIRLNIRMAKAAAEMRVRYVQSFLRRSRFEWVIFRNIFRAPYHVARLIYWTKHPEKYSDADRFHLVKRIIFLIKKYGHIKTFATGRKYLPKEGGYVMYPNHQGKYDAIGIAYCHPGPCTVVMDEKKSHVIVTSQVVDALGGKRLEIDNPRQTVKLFNEITGEVKEGRKYIIFPEGGYENENGNQLGLFKPGAFKAAIKAKAPIVPVALIDSYRAFNSSWFGKVTTFVHFLKPIYYDDYKNMSTAQIADLVKERIETRIRIASQENVRKMIMAAQRT